MTTLDSWNFALWGRLSLELIVSQIVIWCSRRAVRISHLVHQAISHLPPHYNVARQIVLKPRSVIPPQTRGLIKLTPVIGLNRC